MLGAKKYIAKIDVEVFPDVNNYKTHNLYEIKKIDLTEAANAGPLPVATSKVVTSDIGNSPTASPTEPSLVGGNIPQGKKLVNPETKVNNADLPISQNGKPLYPNGADTKKKALTLKQNAKKYGTYQNGTPKHIEGIGDVRK